MVSMQNKKILLVVNDIDARRILSGILTSRGYSVEALNDGRDILDYYFRMPDVFIIDTIAGSIDSTAICKFLKLQSLTSDIPVIIISANHLVKEKAEKAGAYFIPKPYKAEDLLDEIEFALSSREMNGVKRI
jgi:CheY-like chemotaxis protein